MILRRWPDPVLTTAAVPFTDFTDLGRLARVMLAVMRQHNGVGLAANQIGRGDSVLIAELPEYWSPGGRDLDGVLVLTNATLCHTGGLEVASEGCLSVPKRMFNLARPGWITVTGFDVAGEAIELTVVGFSARILAHELDHLAGRTILAPGITA